jgi:hypothetical protein
MFYYTCRGWKLLIFNRINTEDLGIIEIMARGKVFYHSCVRYVSYSLMLGDRYAQRFG